MAGGRRQQGHHMPKMGVRDSAASMNSLVAMALALSASIGTSENDRLKVLASKKVPPGGITGADIVICGIGGCWSV